MENPKFFLTEDGSQTLYNTTLGEYYHSIHGAVQESFYIFIQMGLKHRLHSLFEGNSLNIFEVGFGTGLNALLTIDYQKQIEYPPLINYTTVEKYPLASSVYQKLNFPIGEIQELESLHISLWDSTQEINSKFKLHKMRGDLLEINFPKSIDLVYFDAFSPEIQPELWGEAIFQQLYDNMNEGGVLTTYCAKGEVRRRLQRIGFVVERLPGPPGKREILRATKE